MVVQDQFIMGMNGPVSLNQMAVHAAMDLSDVEFKKDCLLKVVNLGRHFINKMKG